MSSVDRKMKLPKRTVPWVFSERKDRDTADQAFLKDEVPSLPFVFGSFSSLSASGSALGGRSAVGD